MKRSGLRQGEGKHRNSFDVSPMSSMKRSVEKFGCGAYLVWHMEPAIRIERTTCGLRNRCSTN